MNIMFLGDIHAQVHQIPFLTAKSLGADAIFQVGDFGYVYQHKFVDALAKEVRRHEIPVYWIDGNHDNGKYLKDAGAWGASTFQELWPQVFYVPRGMKWEWDGVSFVGLGGAYSIDRPFRTLGVSWWEEEETTERDVERACSHGQVDVLVTHDAPLNVYPLEELLSDAGRNAAIQAQGFRGLDESRLVRRLIAETTNKTKPQLVIHGHYHYRYDGEYHPYGVDSPIRVVGLDQGGQGENSYFMLDTATIREAR